MKHSAHSKYLSLLTLLKKKSYSGDHTV